MSSLVGRIFDHPDGIGALTIAAKTAVIYVFLVTGLRVLGKRELGQMNLADIVLIVVIGNAVQNAMINNDNSLGGGVVSVTTLLLLNRGLNAITRRSPLVERALIGQPVLLVHDRAVIPGRLQREGISQEQLCEALREHGLERVSEAQLCVLEVDGSISVIPTGGPVLRSRRHFKGLRLP